MSISETELKEKAKKAFFEILDYWRKDAEDAIEDAKMDLVSDTPEIFQTATWLNFALGSATQLAPVSKSIATVAEVISKHSMHIYAANAMVSGLHELYKQHARQLDTLLKVHYKRIKARLIHGTRQFKALYKITPLGQKVVAQVVAVARRRINEPDLDEEKASAYLELLFLEAELLDSKDNSLESRVQASVTALSRKIKNVYEGSKFGWGDDSLYIADYNKMRCNIPSLHPITDPFTGQPTACLPDFDLVSRGGGGNIFDGPDFHDAGKFNELLANIWRYDVKFHDSLGPHDAAFARINPNAKTVLQIMAEANEARLEGSQKRLEQVEPAVWQQVMQASKGQVTDWLH